MDSVLSVGGGGMVRAGQSGGGGGVKFIDKVLLTKSRFLQSALLSNKGCKYMRNDTLRNVVIGLVKSRRGQADVVGAGSGGEGPGSESLGLK